MKTVGELLKTTREKKQLTLDTVEKRTKIRKKFLVSLENDAFDTLPSTAYAAGFVKNYASFLRLDTDRVLAVFRRQLDRVEKTKVLPSGVSEPIEQPFWRLTPNKIIGIVVAGLLLVLSGYFYRQYQVVTQPPPLIVVQPANQKTATSTPLAVFGQTDADATVTINGTSVNVGADGKFFEEISLTEGQNRIVIVAQNRLGKQTTVERTVIAELE